MSYPARVELLINTHTHRHTHIYVCVSVCLSVRACARTVFYIFIIKGFRTIVFIFIVISRTFRLICPPIFFRCLSNSGTCTELWTTSFIESTGVACSDSVKHNWVEVLNIPVLLLVCSQDWTSNLHMSVSLEAQGTNAYNCCTYVSGLLYIEMHDIDSMYKQNH